MKVWLLAIAVCSFVSGAFAQTDLRHMRGAHATSNYGVNVAGFRKTVFGAPETIKADSVSVNISRSVTAFGTWDLAAVRMTGVTIGNSPKLASAGFWMSVNPITGATSLAFNPTVDTSLAPVTGFAGEVNLGRSAEGFVDLTPMSRASGTALRLAVAVVANASSLVSGATYQSGTGATLARASLMQSLDAFKASVNTQEGARTRYFEFLRAQNVEWIAITLPIFTDSLADPTVRVKYRPANETGAPYSFDDADLEDFILAAKRADFKVTLAFEFYPVIMDVSPSSPGCGTPQYKPNRWLLGQPVVNPATVQVESCINPADWWWAPSHPQHATNVAIFWNSFTQIAFNYAQLAQRTGVDIFLLSTEQDNLFRTRSAAAPYTNHFRPQLTAMVNAVRSAYTGIVTYEQLWTAIAKPEQYAGGKGTAAAFDGVFDDLNFPVVALSAYFDLASTAPTSVMSVAQFEAAWTNAFTRYIVPLQQRYPAKPIFFSEWGYTNDIAGPFQQGSQLGATMQPGAAGAAGITQQRNIIEAFFNVNARYNDIVAGGFFWGMGFPDPGDCTKVTFGVYCKAESAAALAAGHAGWLRKDADRVFNWAQAVYPNLFKGASSSATISGYWTRFYPETGTYLGVKDGRVYVHNGRDFIYQDVGPFRTFLDMASRVGY